MDEKERARALGATLSQIEKQFGKGSVIRLGGQPVQAVPSISTGSISIDFALGIGGFPRGRVPVRRSGGAIGARGFEPRTSPTRTARATRLRHAPMRRGV